MLSERGKAVFDRLVNEYNKKYTQKTTLSYSKEEQAEARQIMDEPPLPPEYWQNITDLGGSWEISKNENEPFSFSGNSYTDITTVYLREHYDTDTVEFFYIEENTLFQDREASAFRDKERNLVAVYGTIDCNPIRKTIDYRELEKAWKEDYEIEFSEPTAKHLRPVAVVEAFVHSSNGYQGYIDLSSECVSFTHKNPQFENVFVTKDELQKMMQRLGLNDALKLQEKPFNSHKDRVKDKFERE